MKHTLFLLMCFYLSSVIIRLGLSYNGIEWDASTRITDLALTAGVWIAFVSQIIQAILHDTQD